MEMRLCFHVWYWSLENKMKIKDQSPITAFRGAEKFQFSKFFLPPHVSYEKVYIFHMNLFHIFRMSVGPQWGGGEENNNLVLAESTIE